MKNNGCGLVLLLSLVLTVAARADEAVYDLVIKEGRVI